MGSEESMKYFLITLGLASMATFSCTGTPTGSAETKAPSATNEPASGAYQLGYRQCGSDPEAFFEKEGTRDTLVIAERYFGELVGPARAEAIQGCRDALGNAL